MKEDSGLLIIGSTSTAALLLYMSVLSFSILVLDKLPDLVGRSVLQNLQQMDTLARDVRDVLGIPDEIEKMLRPPARTYVKNAKAMFRTPADIYEHPDSYSFLLDMPGLEVDKIKVKVDNGLLHVSGKKKNSKKAAKATDGAKPIRIERRRAKYMRKFTLPQDANPEDVKATYKDGVLTVVVAKKPQEELSKPKTVTIPIS